MTEEVREDIYAKLNFTLDGTGCACVAVTDHKVVLSDEDLGVIILGIGEMKSHTPEWIVSKILDKYAEKLLMAGFQNN